MNLDQTIVQVHIEDIIPNRFQPRLNFDEEGLKELADSIKEHGIIQPLVLRRLGDKFEIIAGERRYKAASLAGLTTVPAVISNVDDNKAAEVAIVENVQRRNLTAIEEARSYKNLLDKGYLTQEGLAKKMGLSQPAIANKLRLLNLDDEVQQALLDEKISERHARTLLSIPDKAMQREWLHRIINERLTVRQLDTELKKLNINTEQEEDNVPSVEVRPSIEEIKANSSDLFADKTSIEDKLKPTESNEEIETLDFEVDNNQLQNNTFVESPNSTSNLEGTFNPIENDNSDNKYFNFTSSEDNTYVSPTDENTTNDNSFEIIDDNPVEEEKIPQSEENPFAIEEEKAKPVNLEDNDISTEFTISSNNKFFTPIREKENDTLLEDKKKVENPMDRVNKLSPSYQEQLKEQKGTSLKDSISIVRKSIDELGKRGIYAEIEEIDFNDFYQITIKIAKDDN